MLRHLNDEIVGNLKDGLRGVRHVIRARRRDRLPPLRRPQTPSELPGMVLGTAAAVIDTALSLAQSVSVPLIYEDMDAASRSGRARSLTRYFAQPDGSRLFRREMYYLTRELLQRSHEEAVFVHEAVFADIHLHLESHHKKVLAQAVSQAASDGDIARACAAFAIESIRRHPARRIGRGAPLPVTSPLDTHMEIIVFSALALACALGTAQHRDGLGDDGADLIESALLAVSAQEDRFLAAFESDDPHDALAERFSGLMAYLP
ncbi:hypothetical protein [Brucella sp. IR073]|uniref:hypothetical protein n=1 Tax=unclassified Brucella TaxID=2632610 RepID=UPI003B984A78